MNTASVFNSGFCGIFSQFGLKMLPGFTTAVWLSAGAITALGVVLAIPVHSAKRNDNMAGGSKDSIRFALNDKKTLLSCILKNGCGLVAQW